MDEDKDKETVICRCEDITLYDLKELLAGCRTLDEVKRLGRLGMGPCQGRTCLALAARVLAQERNCSLEEVAMPAARPPVVPVPLGDLAGGDEARG